MLTHEEQILFIKDQCKRQQKLLQQWSKHFGSIHQEMFTEQINHTLFCYDALLATLQEFHKLKNS